MTRHLLLPGSDGSARIWDRVVACLGDAGTRAETVTLSAPGVLGRLAHDLARQVEIVEAQLAAGPPGKHRRTVLVPYSYSGLVASAVGRRRPDALARIIFVDAILPEISPDPDALPKHVPPVVRALLGEGASELLAGPLPAEVPVTYVACTGRRHTPAFDAIDRSAAYARAKGLDSGADWLYLELPTGHRPMIEDPSGLAGLLTLQPSG